MKQVVYVLVGVFVGFILAGGIFIVTRLPGGKPIMLEAAPTKVPIEVDVVGGVVHPGVYALPDGSRVQDAVDAAGGLIAGTDVSSINMAARLEDGQQVQIPGGLPASQPQGSNTVPFTILTTPAATATSLAAADLININTATLAELDSLPNIGATTAQNIITYRTQHGPFARIEDIMNVPGIGPSTFDAIKNLITVGMP